MRSSRWPSLPWEAVGAVMAFPAIGWADATTLGTYALTPLLVLAITTTFLWAVYLFDDRLPNLGSACTGLAVCGSLATLFVGARVFHGGLYAHGAALSVSVLLVVVAASVAVVLVLARRTEPAVVTVAVLILAAGACMLVASPDPRIDVWHMFQTVSAGLLHGHGIYTQHLNTRAAGGPSTFAYPPGGVLLLAPFYLVFSDVRAGVLLATILSALVMVVAPRAQTSLLAVLLLLYPLLTFAVEQSWSEPLVLLGLVLTARLVRAGRTRWAVLTMASVLTLQQYDVLFLPLAMAWSEFGPRRAAYSAVAAGAFTLPWAVSSPGAFVHGTVTYALHYALAYQSLSVFAPLSRIAPSLAYAALVGATVVGLGVTAYRVRLRGCFLYGCGMLLLTIDLFDKITRFNEWQLGAGLLLAGGAEAVSLTRRRLPRTLPAEVAITAAPLGEVTTDLALAPPTRDTPLPTRTGLLARPPGAPGR